MIVTDSSAWIDHLRGRSSHAASSLRQAIASGSVLLGDVILLELLQGAGNEAQARRLQRELAAFPIAQMLNPRLAETAAANFRRLRAKGITVRKTVDVIIATYCIEHGHALLHADRDFVPFAEHLGLVVV